MQAFQSDTRYDRMSQTTLPAGSSSGHATAATDSELLAVKEFFNERMGGSDLLKGLEDVGGLTFELDPDHQSIHAHAPRAIRLLICRREEGYISVCIWAYITVHDRKPVTLTLVEETVTPGHEQPTRRLLRWDEVPGRPLLSPFEACMEATNNNVPLLKALARYYFLWKGVVSWEELVHDKQAWFLGELHTTLQKMKKSAAQTEGSSVGTPDTKRPEIPAASNKLLPFSRGGSFQRVNTPSVSARPSFERLATQRHGSETSVGQMQRPSLMRDTKAWNSSVQLSDPNSPTAAPTPQETRLVNAVKSAIAAQTSQRTARADTVGSTGNFLNTLAPTPSITNIDISKRKASFNEEKIRKLLAFGEKMQETESILEQLDAHKVRVEKMKQDQQKEFEEQFGDLTPWEVMAFMAKRLKKG